MTDAEINLRIWLIGQLCELRSLGLIGGGHDLTVTGMVDYRNLVMEGYRPTKEQALPILQELGNEIAEPLWLLIVDRLDRPNYQLDFIRQHAHECEPPA